MQRRQTYITCQLQSVISSETDGDFNRNVILARSTQHNQSLLQTNHSQNTSLIYKYSQFVWINTSSNLSAS